MNPIQDMNLRVGRLTPVQLAVLWLCAYLAIVLAPVFMLLIGPVPPGSGMLWDFSMALGFSGMAMMSVQFLLTARFRRACAPFGIDIIYFFHRYLALLALTLIGLHGLIVRVWHSEAVGAINPFQAHWYMTAGRAALLLFAAVIITSLWRKFFAIHYDRWRRLHIVLTVAAVLLALAHIEGVGYYIHAPAKRWLWTAYTLGWLLLVVHVRVIKPWRMTRLPYRVTALRRERGHCWTLTLEPVGHHGISFSPGQFAWLSLRTSPWRIREHPFSIASGNGQCNKLEFTIKELGDFTRTIGATRVGERAFVDGPYGVFTVDRYPLAAGFVFIAGGIGIAPVISMLRSLAERCEKRPLWLIYANNCWQDVTFREELESLQRQLSLNVVHVLKEPPLDWEGERGLVTPELLRRVLPAQALRFEYFLCGPTAMSVAVQRGLHDFKVPLGQVHFELFEMV